MSAVRTDVPRSGGDTAARVRRYRADLVAGGVFAAVVGIPYPWDLHAPGAPGIVLAAASIAVRRLSPGFALVLAWCTAGTQVLLGERPSLLQVATVVVLYAAAAHGTPAVVRAAAVSAVVGGAVAAPYLIATGARYTALFAAATAEQRVLIALLPLVLLVAGWLAGYAVRVSRSNRAVVEERSIAEERADRAVDAAEVERVRAEIARDVHDVVGHSLAVIIAQADAAELTGDADRARAMVREIGRTARSSLEEVRSVLSRTGAAADAGDEPALDDLIASVRSASAPLDDRVEGEPYELRQEPAAVARRILQEMLTNALRHGRPGGRISVTRSWRPGALILEVADEPAEGGTAGSGHGIRGMRSRLAAVGGSLEVDRTDRAFIARARIPTR